MTSPCETCTLVLFLLTSFIFLVLCISATKRSDQSEMFEFINHITADGHKSDPHVSRQYVDWTERLRVVDQTCLESRVVSVNRPFQLL